MKSVYMSEHQVVFLVVYEERTENVLSPFLW